MSRVFACVSCTTRKVKCDKEQPICSTCSRLKLECVYSETPPAPKRKRANSDDLARLEEYERLLKHHGLLQAPLPLRGTLLQQPNQRRYVDSVLWNAIGDNAEYDDTVTDQPNLVSTALLGAAHHFVDLSAYRPVDLDAYWSIYVERVDPLVKILHKPTAMQSMMEHESLLFAVCLAAILTLTEEETLRLGATKAQLTTRFHEATQIALLNAKFLSSNVIQVLQAFTLFLVMCRSRFEAMTVWIMTGVGMRIGQRLGLHRDGSLIGLSPFDTEINRRLFWQYPSLEGYGGQVAGINSSLDSARWDTIQALNLNDEDIWPGMVDPPIPRKEATDMIFHLTKSTFVEFYGYLGPVLAKLERQMDNTKLLEEAEGKLREIEDKIEVEYLRYCDPMEPLHLVTSVMARVAVQCGIFRLRLPRAKAGLMSEAESERMYVLALKIIDRLVAAHLNPLLDRYRWHTDMFVVWDVIIWLVNYVRKEADKKAAWKSLESLCKYHPEIVEPRQGLTYAIIKLILKAWDSSMTGSPEFIISLREKLDARSTPTITPPPVVDFEQTDGYDWAFWDRLMKEPDSLAYLVGQ